MAGVHVFLNKSINPSPYTWKYELPLIWCSLWAGQTLHIYYIFSSLEQSHDTGTIIAVLQPGEMGELECL